METRQLLDVLKRRKWIIVQSIIWVMVVAVVVTKLLMPVMFDSESDVLAEAPDIDLGLLQRMGMKALSGTTNVPQPIDIETRQDLVTMDPLVTYVINRLQIRDGHDQLLLSKTLSTPGTLSLLINTIKGLPSVSVTQTGHASLISITARSCDPDEAFNISQLLTDAFIQDALSYRRREIDAAKIFVDRQLGTVRDDYHRVLGEMAAWQKSHGTVNLETETKVDIEKLADLMMRKDEVVGALAEVRAKLSVVRSQLGRESGSDIPTEMLKMNPQLEVLKHRLSELREQMASCLTEKTVAHPDCDAIARQIKEAEADLSRELAVAKASFPDMDELQRQVKAQEAHLGSVDRDIRQYSVMLSGVPDKSLDEQKLRLALESARNVYSSLLDYRNQLGVVEAMTVSDVRLVQPAVHPDESKPTSPKPYLNYALGIITSLGVGVGLAFLREYTDEAVREVEDLDEEGLPFLGKIPRSRLRSLIANLDANDPRSEAYRTIRGGLQLSCLESPPRKILLTSGGPDEGRTTVAANLAVSYGRAGQRTLLVDADLRRPKLHRLFSMSNERGLSSIITGHCRLDEAISETGVENLSVLPSGPVPPDPGGLFESARMSRLLEVLGRRFEVVILDSAPLLIKSDAALLLPQVDATAYIVEASRTTRRAVEAAADVFRAAGIKPAGVIINKARARWKLKPRTRIVLIVAAVLVVLAVVALAVYYPKIFQRGS